MQTDEIIEQLTAQLQPVRVLPSPAWRALLWLVLVGAVSAALIVAFAQSSALQRMTSMRVMLECLGTFLTAITAIVAAFELSVPDRSPHWAWLPLPPLLLWLAASGAGCWRNGLSLHGPGGLAGESPHCFAFITAVSVPLAVLLFSMLRRARPMDPLPVAATGTLGVAAMAAFVLEFFHPFDVTVIDLALHLAAVGLIVLLGTALRRPLLAAS